MAIDTDNRFERELRREGGEREDIRREGREFDAREAFQETAEAGYDRLQERRGEELEDLRSRQVGAGRTRTGFGFEDQDRLAEEMERNFQRQLAGQALQAEQMNLRNLEGRRRSNRYLDLLTSERERKEREEGRLWELGGKALGTAAGIAF